MLVQKDSEINLFWLCNLYQSMLLIIKNKKHQRNIVKALPKHDVYKICET